MISATAGSNASQLYWVSVLISQLLRTAMSNYFRKQSINVLNVQVTQQQLKLVPKLSAKKSLVRRKKDNEMM